MVTIMCCREINPFVSPSGKLVSFDQHFLLPRPPLVIILLCWGLNGCVPQARVSEQLRSGRLWSLWDCHLAIKSGSWEWSLR